MIYVEEKREDKITLYLWLARSTKDDLWILSIERLTWCVKTSHFLVFYKLKYKCAKVRSKFQGKLLAKKNEKPCKCKWWLTNKHSFIIVQWMPLNTVWGKTY